MDPLEKLIAIEEIKQLEAKRVRLLDTKDWVPYAALHVPEMEHTYGMAPPAYGIDNVVAKVSSLLNNAITIHHIHSPEIEFPSSTTAKAIWAMEDTVIWLDEGTRMHAFGHYFCDYVYRDGKWLICGRDLKRLWVKQEKGGTTYDLVKPAGNKI
jgi:hypothetical protein